MTAPFFVVGNPPKLPEGATLLTQPPEHGAKTPFLQWHNGRYFLCDSDQRYQPLTINFLDKTYQNRHGVEYLPKAFRHLVGERIADATAGWGKDGWLLAQRGFVLTFYERNPYLFTLLQAALTEAQMAGDPTAERISLVFADAIHALSAGEFAAIYLDPMYPKRRKSAKVKQSMQVLQDLLSGESSAEDESTLLTKALASASKRVVVKRPKNAEFLAGRKPSYQIYSPNTRYDVYQSKSA